MAGIDANGFEAKRLDQVLAENQADFKLIYGDNLNVAPESRDGATIGVVSASQADLWEIAEGSYNTFNPATVTGAAQSSLVQLNGITREAASFSTITLRITGTIGTTIAEDSPVSTVDKSVTFRTDAEVVIPGAGFIDVDATAITTGPIEAVAGTVTNIDEPITGWSSVTNPADASPGSDAETDAELRSRRERSVSKPAKGIAETILAEVLAVPNVEEAFFYNNPLRTIDIPTNTPPNSFQVIVLGGTDTAIANAIFSEMTTGIEAYGTTVIPVNDNQGNPQDVGLTRPNTISIYVIVNLTTFGNYPPDGDDTIKQNIVDYADGNFVVGRGFGVGIDVIQSELCTPVNAVQGSSINSILIGIAPGPTLEDNIAIEFDETSDFVIGNITVNGVPG